MAAKTAEYGGRLTSINCDSPPPAFHLHHLPRKPHLLVLGQVRPPEHPLACAGVLRAFNPLIFIVSLSLPHSGFQASSVVEVHDQLGTLQAVFTDQTQVFCPPLFCCEQCSQRCLLHLPMANSRLPSLSTCTPSMTPSSLNTSPSHNHT